MLPQVEYSKLKPRALGGTHGKTEHRKHIKVKRLVGSKGDKHIFEGECPECSQKFFAMRKPNSRGLFKCKECNFTSFIYKGYFNLNDYKVEPPKQNEFEGTLWKAKYNYAGEEEVEFYGSKEFVHKGDKWEQLEEPEIV